MLLFYGRKINASLAPQPCHKTPLQRLRQDIEPRRGKVTLKDIEPVEDSGEHIHKAFLRLWLAFQVRDVTRFGLLFYLFNRVWMHVHSFSLPVCLLAYLHCQRKALTVLLLVLPLAFSDTSFVSPSCYSQGHHVSNDNPGRVTLSFHHDCL